MKYRERDRVVAELRELADFIESRGHMLPGYVSVSASAALYLSDTDYKRNPETGEYESTLNEEKTKQNLKRALVAFGSCEKEYREDRIEIRKKNSFDRVMLRGTVDRSVACKRVVVGQELQPAAFVQAKLVDKVEWQCDEGISLLKLVS